MSTLGDYKLHYEDISLITRKGGKDSKMSKNNKQVEAPAKTYNKSRGEHIKDMLIVALVVGIVGFVGGMQFSSRQAAEIREAVTQAQDVTAQAEAPVKK